MWNIREECVINFFYCDVTIDILPNSGELEVTFRVKKMCTVKAVFNYIALEI